MSRGREAFPRQAPGSGESRRRHRTHRGRPATSSFSWSFRPVWTVRGLMLPVWGRARHSLFSSRAGTCLRRMRTRPPSGLHLVPRLRQHGQGSGRFITNVSRGPAGPAKPWTPVPRGAQQELGQSPGHRASRTLPSAARSGQELRAAVPESEERVRAPLTAPHGQTLRSQL